MILFYVNIYASGREGVPWESMTKALSVPRKPGNMIGIAVRHYYQKGSTWRFTNIDFIPESKHAQ